MSDIPGSTRTTVKGQYSVLTPDSLVHTPLPGWKNAECVALTSPSMGSRFTELLVELGMDGIGAGNTGPREFFIYAVDGAGSILVNERRTRLEAGSYVYLPPDTDMQIKSGGTSLQLLVVQKKYAPFSGKDTPVALTGHERDVRKHDLYGQNLIHEQALLPIDPAFDMEVKIYTYQPGATLPRVQYQVQERGIMMLGGAAIFRFGTDRHEVQRGDIIRVGPACPFWLGTNGDAPASLIYFVEANRDPM